MKTDPGEKPYPCAQCKKIFTSNGHLKQHLSNHASCGFWLYSFVLISVSASLVWTRDIENATNIVSYGILTRGKFKVTLEDTYWKKTFSMHSM